MSAPQHFYVACKKRSAKNLLDLPSEAGRRPVVFVGSLKDVFTALVAYS